jgi:putative nucleotidyltransferase with HDIG domain
MSRSRPAAASSRALRTYVQVVGTIGAAVLVHELFLAAFVPHPLAWLALASLAFLAEAFRLHFASVSANIAIGDTFFIATAVLFGPAPATLSTATAGLLYSWLRKKPARQVVFNPAALAVSMAVASRAFFFAAGVEPLSLTATPVATLVGPLLILTLTYFALNSGLTAVAIALDTRQSPIVVWKRNFGWLWIGYLAGASVAFCLILLLQQHSLAAVSLVLPLFAVFYLTLRSTFGRLDDARRHLGDVDRLYLSTVETLAMAIDAKDDVTHSHVRRVQTYAVGLAQALNITDAPTLKAIQAAALLHDTGKLAVPERILNKPGKLTAGEFDRMKEHVDIGADILSLVQFPYPVVPIVRAHHESWDGSGYPRGLAGDDIPIGARILSVVDCFDALTSDRPYRGRMTDAEAVAILRERQGTMYDPQVVDTFVRVYRDIAVDRVDFPEHRQVMQRVTQSRHEMVEPPRQPLLDMPPTASAGLLAFVSLSRVASGEAGLSDVFALGSRLLADVVPGASGAWFVADARGDRLIAADTFGPASTVLRGLTIANGERLTGWVAANRQCIINSEASLDLGAAAAAASLESCMSVPLMMGDTLVGVLSLYAPARNAFSDDCGRLVQMVAPQLASAMHASAAAADARTPLDKASPAALRLVVGG